MIKNTLLAASVAGGVIVPAQAGVILPPKLEIAKPAIIKPENIEFSKNMLAMPFTLGMLPGKGVPISYVSFATAAATTLTMPSHQAGDLLVMVGIRSTTGTFSAAPSPWVATFSDTTTSTSFQIRVATQIAASGSTTSGTWTGASQLNCFVYRGATLGASAFAYRSGTSWTWPSITMQVTNGSSWVAGFSRASAASSFSIPAGRTSRVNGGVGALDLWDTNGGVSSYTADTLTGSTSNGWFGTLELKE